MNDGIVPLLDLSPGIRSIREELDKAIRGVLESGAFILGPNVKAFEEEVAAYLGVRAAVGVNSGTDALVLAMDALGLKPGDEVITTPYTFFATAESISRLGATPVFVDIEPLTFNIDPVRIEEKITPRTRGILPVHLFGHPADMDPIMDVAKKHNLWVVEDACQAIGAIYKGRRAGSIGDAGCFSFFPTKNLGGMGDGGMVATSNDILAKRIKVLRAHGSSRKYHHEELGYNSRLDEIQAAMLRVKLPHLDDWNEMRREKAALYEKTLAGTPVTLPYAAPDGTHIYHLYIVRCELKKKLLEALASEGIGCGDYYPVPLHLQGVYNTLGYREGSLPTAERAARETLALPMFPELQSVQIERVAEVVRSAFGAISQ